MTTGNQNRISMKLPSQTFTSTPLARLLVRATGGSVLLATLALLSPHTHAEVLIGNLPSNDGFSTLVRVNQFQKAVVFTIGDDDFAVDDVILRLSNYNTATDVAQVGFFLDDGFGTNIGSQVGSFLLAPASSSNTATDFIFTPVGSLNLVAHTRYWLLVDASASEFNWNSSVPGLIPTGTDATSDFYRNSTDDGFTYVDSTTLNSFQINGAAVPEPSTVFFGAIGILGLAFRRIRNHRNG